MTRKRLLIIGALALTLVLGAGAYLAASTWGDVNRVSIDRPQAAGEDGPVEVGEAEPPGEEIENTDFTVPPSGDGLDVHLIVVSDSRSDLDDLEGFGDFVGQRADVVMVLIRPRKPGAEAAILSVPRDLWVEKICGKGYTRVNETIEGCESMNGPTLLVSTIEELIGVPIDHFAMVDLAGFQEAVDAIGGYEICVELPVRDSRADLDLDDGCTLADGKTALAWLRSRHTQELTENGWRTMAGVSDLTRNARQREFLISMMSRVSDITNPQGVLAIARAVAPFVTVDDGLTLIDAVGLASTMKGMQSGDIAELEIPVADYVTEQGANVLVATADVAALVQEFLSPSTASGGQGETG